MTSSLNRRQILRLGIGFTATCYTLGNTDSRAIAAPAKRSRYLINLQGFGGCDSSWHHSPVLVRDTTGLSTEQINSLFYGVFPQERFPDSVARSFGGGFLGPTLELFSNNELSQMLIWRGIVAEGSHKVGNHMIQDGHLSGYAASFSTIIADALSRAPDYTRSLHYVQITADSAGFNSQIGFYRGPGVPLNVPDPATWTGLSSTDAKDPVTSVQLKALLDGTIAKLAAETGKLKQDASRRLYETEFLDTYNRAATMLGKNYATTPAFVATMGRYRKAIVDDLSALLFTSSATESLRLAISKMPGTPSGASSVETFLNTIFNLDQKVFPYALADFLVTNDLSAVVDVPMLAFSDFHDLNDQDLLAVSLHFACLRSMMQKLKSTEVPDGSGASFMDRTLIVMSTEFDRQVGRSVLNQAYADRPGTDHGATSSVVMAGYGCNGGHIVGGRATGPQGVYGAIGVPFLQPLPIDLNSGEPNANGVKVTQQAVLPTILQIFGLSVPSQQRTEQVAVPAVIKPGHSGA